MGKNLNHCNSLWPKLFVTQFKSKYISVASSYMCERTPTIWYALRALEWVGTQQSLQARKPAFQTMGILLKGLESPDDL
jgi:hypothetical protein